MAEVFDKVKQIIVDELAVDEALVKPEARLVEDLGADSIDAVELIMTVEDAFSIEISDEVLQNIKTVNDLVSYIKDNQ
ncbi:Acyl carrier protein [Acholeplasma oculi]|uniref:Acyl carrier protein n=1 Tax=Acholeplasma oculi TaxID=35623 RepID=A0A061ABP9_9MOLU|nr:acyl carrier protein [Acholeplasma oculi]CDR31295.1 Acyl carrier protein [Acholeplasma oculi]SKC38774.1 acyl carrier protein [Acholeplasma oculi]SUT91510.1 Acyl carrier protein [Acholeplasma oculi]